MAKKHILIWVFMVVILVACSNTDGLEQIASYPKEKPIAVYPRTPESLVVYNATFDMDVSNVEHAAERAKEIAFEQGGYLVSINSWFRDGEKHTTVLLAVPAHRFDSTRDDLLRLGTLAGEWISSELVPIGIGEQGTYSQITIYLHPKDSALPEISLPKWRPVRTFGRAWNVFVSIFGFLLDIVIWVIVVVGPFLLIGWGIRWLFQRWQKR